MGDGADVTIRGVGKYIGNAEIVISVTRVPGERNLVEINPTSITVDGVKAFGPMLYWEVLGMFSATGMGTNWDGLTLGW